MKIESKLVCYVDHLKELQQAMRVVDDSMYQSIIWVDGHNVIHCQYDFDMSDPKNKRWKKVI